MTHGKILEIRENEENNIRESLEILYLYLALHVWSALALISWIAMSMSRYLVSAVSRRPFSAYQNHKAIFNAHMKQTSQRALLERFDLNLFSPYPFAIPTTTAKTLKDVVAVTHQALHGIVAAYFNNNAKVQAVLDLPPDQHAALLRLHRRRKATGGTPYEIGSWRPDFLLANESSNSTAGIESGIAAEGLSQLAPNNFVPKICEINARFPFNGFYGSTAVTHAVNDSSFMKQTACFPFTEQFQIPDYFAGSFCEGDTIAMVKGREAGFDVHTFVDVMKQTDAITGLVMVTPDMLALDEKQRLVARVPRDDLPKALLPSANMSGSMDDGRVAVAIDAVALELHQDELMSLPEDIFDAVANCAVLNPLETILLVHDKRMLALLTDPTILEDIVGCNDQQIELLRNHIVPTHVVSQVRDDPNFFQDHTQWMLKPNLLGKGEGFIFGHECESRAEWDQRVREVPGTWVAQPVISQTLFPISMPDDSPDVPPQAARVVGLLPCLGPKFFGPGFYRASSDLVNSIVNVSRSKSTILASATHSNPWQLSPEQCFPLDHPLTTATHDIPDDIAFDGATANGYVDEISLCLEKHGVVAVKNFLPQAHQDLISTSSSTPASNRPNEDLNHQILQFLDNFGSAVNHDMAGTPVWDVQPLQKTEARSQSSLPFVMHTDSSFEEPPPRYVAFYVVQQDRKGGGLLHLMPTQHLHNVLSRSALWTLQNTVFDFHVPKEFRKTLDAQTLAGHVLSKSGLWRYRRDIVSQSGITTGQKNALAELNATLADVRGEVSRMSFVYFWPVHPCSHSLPHVKSHAHTHTHTHTHTNIAPKA